MVPTSAGPGLSWNLVHDVRQLFQFGFMVNALRAGTVVAVMAAVIGWFMVVRRQSFAGHTIAVVGFPGAAGATLIGVSALYGYFAFCVLAALLISAVPAFAGRAFSQENAVTGTVQTFLLALGFLFVSLYRGNLNGINALLFGNFLGITDGAGPHPAPGGVGCTRRPRRHQPAAAVRLDRSRRRRGPRACPCGGCRCCSSSCWAWPPPRPARSPVRCSCSPSWSCPPPPPSASRPARSSGALIAVGIGLAVTWLGLAVAYYSPYPIGFWVTTFAFGAYLARRSGRQTRPGSRWTLRAPA